MVLSGVVELKSGVVVLKMVLSGVVELKSGVMVLKNGVVWC